MYPAVEEFIQSVRTRAPRAPVVFVSSHADQGIAPCGVEEALKEFEMHNTKHFHVSCKDGTGMDDLIKHLRQLANNLNIEQRVPQSFIELERILKNDFPTPGGAVPLHQVLRACQDNRLDITEKQVMVTDIKMSTLYLHQAYGFACRSYWV